MTTHIQKLNIALFQPEIPQNTASLMRFCACMNVTLHIIEPAGFLISDKHLKRIAMDYESLCKVILHTNFQKFQDWAQKNGSRLILMTTKTSTSYTSFEFRPNDSLIMGQESAGVPDIIHNTIAHKLTIPMPNTNARSLNVAMSAAITASEAIRQLNGQNEKEDLTQV